MFGKPKKVAFSEASLETALVVALKSDKAENLEEVAKLTAPEHRDLRDKIALILMNKAVATPFNDFKSDPDQNILLAHVMRVADLGISRQAAEQLIEKMIGIGDFGRASRIAVNKAGRALTDSELERLIASCISFGDAGSLVGLLQQCKRNLTLKER